MPRHSASASLHADSVPPSTNARSRSKRDAPSGTTTSDHTGPGQSSRWTVVRPWQPPTRRPGVDGASDVPAPSSSTNTQAYRELTEGETDESIDIDPQALDDWDNEDQAVAHSDPDEQDAIPGEHPGGRAHADWVYPAEEHARSGAVGVGRRRQVRNDQLSLAYPGRLDQEGVDGSMTSSARMQLEVVDVNSTAVSLAVFGQADVDEGSRAPYRRSDSRSRAESGQGRQTRKGRRTHAQDNSSPQEYLADRTRGRYAVQDSYAPPNISIKLNSHQWPHVFHTDASSISDVDMAGDAPDMSADAEALLTANHQPSSSVSSILVWGLSPGKRYHIELGVFSSDAVDVITDNDDDELEAEESVDVADGDGHESALETLIVEEDEGAINGELRTGHWPDDAGEAFDEDDEEECNSTATEESDQQTEDGEAEEASPLTTIDAVQAVASANLGRSSHASEPDVPPPPYSSHDPSLPSNASQSAEAHLRGILEQLRNNAKQAEATLQSSIVSLRRANDKLTREDQRHRQRIHMLEDSTSRLRDLAQEEDGESATLQEAVTDLEEVETTLLARLKRRRSALEESERRAKEESDGQEGEIQDLQERVEAAALREDAVLARKLRMERDLLPTYNIRLATLEADLRRLADDQRRHLGYTSSPHLAQAYSRYVGSPPNAMDAPSGSMSSAGRGASGLRHLPGDGVAPMFDAAEADAYLQDQQSYTEQSGSHATDAPFSTPYRFDGPDRAASVDPSGDDGAYGGAGPWQQGGYESVPTWDQTSSLETGPGMAAESTSREAEGGGALASASAADLGAGDLRRGGSALDAAENTTAVRPMGSRLPLDDQDDDHTKTRHSWASKVAGESGGGSSGSSSNNARRFKQALSEEMA